MRAPTNLHSDLPEKTAVKMSARDFRGQTFDLRVTVSTQNDAQLVRHSIVGNTRKTYFLRLKAVLKTISSTKLHAAIFAKIKLFFIHITEHRCRLL